MQKPVACTHCGAVIENDDYYDVDGAIICEQYRDRHCVTCDSCHRVIWPEDAMGDESISLCQRCYDSYYTTCCRCDRIVPNDDSYEHCDDYYCRDCYDEIRETEAIHDYYYKPKPVFFSVKDAVPGTRFFGVELEMDAGGKDDDHAEELLDIANGTEKRIYFKSDGSLDDGMELVTHPMTLDYHLHHFCWDELLHRAALQGYRSHQTSTCGLHVHVNRRSFGATDDEQEASISRVLYFVEHHWNELLKFSRRSEYAMNRWAARYGYESTPQKIMDKAKSGCGRYCAVNLLPSQTIEFRMFRGTLKRNTLIATLQMVDRICETACRLSDNELAGLSWSDFVRTIIEPELIQYLKERMLYVSDAVTAEEEI